MPIVDVKGVVAAHSGLPPAPRHPSQPNPIRPLSFSSTQLITAPLSLTRFVGNKKRKAFGSQASQGEASRSRPRSRSNRPQWCAFERTAILYARLGRSNRNRNRSRAPDPGAKALLARSRSRTRSPISAVFSVPPLILPPSHPPHPHHRPWTSLTSGRVTGSSPRGRHDGPGWDPTPSTTTPLTRRPIARRRRRGGGGPPRGRSAGPRGSWGR